MEIQSDNNFTKAIYLAREGKLLHSLQILLKLYEQHPEDNLLILKIAEIYEKLGNPDSIIKLIDEVNPINLADEYLLQIAQIYIRNSFFEKAADLISIVDKTLFPESYFLKGQSLFLNNEYEIAAMNFLEFVNNCKQSDILGEAYQYLAECSLIQKKYDTALQYAEKAESLSVLNPELNYILSKIYYLKEMHFHAKEYIVKALKMNESVKDFQDLAGRIFYMTGDYGKAEKYLKASAENKDDSEIYSLIGLSCLRQKKSEEAFEFFNKSLKINPNDLIAKSALADCNK